MLTLIIIIRVIPHFCGSWVVQSHTPTITTIWTATTKWHILHRSMQRREHSLATLHVSIVRICHGVQLGQLTLC